MSKKGSFTTSDYIDFNLATEKANNLLKEDKTKIIGLYIIVSINTGLRISDVLKLTWEQLNSDLITINEKKTGKKKTIKINNNIKDALMNFERDKTGLVFLSQKKSVFSRQHINKLIKDVFSNECKNLSISSHSLRKGFARSLYSKHGESDKILMYLSEILNHTSVQTTRKYLGLRQAELNDIYDSL